MKWEKMTSDEKTTYAELEQFYEKIQREEITIPKLKEYLAEQIDKLTWLTSDPETPKEKRNNLIMELRTMMIINRFICAPENAKKLFEREIKQKYNL